MKIENLQISATRSRDETGRAREGPICGGDPRMQALKVSAAGGFCCLVLLATGVLMAQTQADEHLDDGAKKMMKSSDATFALKAAQGGIAEVKLGQLALDKANSPDVKSFAQKMIDDHSKANDQLKAAAAKGRMTLPNTMNPKDQSLYNKLRDLSGPAFDKAYMKAMVKDHEEDIKEFQNEANKGTNAEIKSFASATLPTLQQHLELAKSAEQKVSASGS
jgi:putative membrane protein